MTVKLISPQGMLQPAPYHHVAVAQGTTHVHVAGQVGRRGDEASAYGDLSAQVAEALRSTALGLAGAGATFQDVVRLTLYVTQWSPEKIEPLMAGVQSVAEELGLPMPMPPASLIGVETLFEPGVLVEVEATAILP
ncbi:RidA family protein [Kribbella sp. CA-293567]|uniref:RidA family protein n=1 Tax=Kribbella sp. CA-293567 TaxID=3002436 RepID=UPI0022DDEBAB|nr:RidA family protein [Kribbella sp. CA-293567]WBQ03463.1 RidA family protein [Kribbella sp. CA-293567]